MKREEIILVYDKECPACNNYCQVVRIRDTVGELTIISSYFIMPEAFGYKNSVMYQTPVLPEYGDYLLDFYVFPKNMAWSMAFAHESGSQMLDLGPYFSKHPDYEKLQKNNVKSFNAKNRY